MSDNPTEQFSPVPEEDQDEGSSKKWWVVFGVLALVAAVIAFLVISAGGDDTEPASSDSDTAATPTPSESTPTEATPTPTATNANPEAQGGPKITKFVTTRTLRCNTQTEVPMPLYINFQWSTTGADKVYLGVDTADASAAPLFDNLPNSGTQNDFPSGYSPYEYNCPRAQQSFTLTIVGGGKKVSKTVTVVNEGDTE